jgi:hypothetical protein
LKHPAPVPIVHVRRRIVATGIDREKLGAGTGDRQRVGDEQLALGQQNRPCASGEQRWIEANLIRPRDGVRRDDRLPQRRAAVGRVDRVVEHVDRDDGQEPPVLQTLAREPPNMRSA